MSSTAVPPIRTLVSLRLSCGSQKSPVFALVYRISVREMRKFRDIATVPCQRNGYSECFAKNRSMNLVSNFPSRKSSSLKMP